MSAESSKPDVAKIAELARIELSGADLNSLQSDIANIVDYFEQLGELDVEGIEPTAHATVMTNVWREDEAKDSFPRETMLANAPETVDEELIKVPRVLPGEGMN